MPRTKGSKNKVKSSSIDYAAQIDKKQKELEVLLAALNENTAKMTELKDAIKAQKRGIKKTEKEIANLKKKQDDIEAKAAAEAKKPEAQNVVNQLLKDGMSADEIIAKLK